MIQINTRRNLYSVPEEPVEVGQTRIEDLFFRRYNIIRPYVSASHLHPWPEWVVSMENDPSYDPNEEYVVGSPYLMQSTITIETWNRLCEDWS